MQINKIRNRKWFYNAFQGGVLLYIAISSTFVFFSTFESFRVEREYDQLYARIDGLEKLIKVRTQEIDVLSLELNKDNFSRVCAYYNVQFDTIVYRQAVLESSNFTSELCRKYNNFLGLYDSRNHDYYKFKHWSECIKSYRDLVQYKYNPEKYGVDYYDFLKKLPYAEDSLYILKLKGL